MQEIFEYSGITTKIKAMSRNLITDEGFREMVAFPNVSAVTSYIKALPAYTDALSNINEETASRRQLEALIQKTKYDDYASIYLFAGARQRAFLKYYVMHYDIKIIKRVLNSVTDGGRSDRSLAEFSPFFDKYSQISPDELMKADSIEAVVNALSGTSYYEPLKKVSLREKAELFDYETALDFHYFMTVWKNRKRICGNGINDRVIERTYGTEFDMLNICWIKRAKTYFAMEAAEIYTLLIPVRYKLKKEDIKHLVESKGDEEFKRALSGTFYGKKFKELNPDTVFMQYAEIPRKMLLKLASKNPYSIAVIFNYLYMKEVEINKIIIAVECVRYGIPEQEAFEYIHQNNEVI